MHTEVVHHYKAAPTPTLSFETRYKGEECIMVVVAFEDLRVDDPSLLTDGANYTDRGPSVV